MANSVSRKKRRRRLPDIPQVPLAVPIIDNHTHIYPDPKGNAEDPQGAPIQNRDDEGFLRMPVLLEMLKEGMRAAGVRGAITSGCDVPALKFTRDLARDNPEIYAALAIHPNEAVLHAGVREIGPDGLPPRVELWHEQFTLDEAIAQVADLARDDAVVAIGETGLDYFRTGEQGAAAQKQSFRDHIALAKELDKPMQIHDRDAHADVVEILLADGAPERTVFHCFTGDRELAEICAANDWYMSFAGPVTYGPNVDLQEAFDVAPDDLVLVETDAPYLTPVPFRGQPNAAWAVVYTAEFLAERRGIALEEYCEILNRNTYHVYGI
ncbi:MAG: TatD family hydrolase [Actinomycetaceae bacterium]|nr:TatD family hydrolase [Actinomycetaceae bacterium]